MIELNSLSKIGFGTYRCSLKSKENIKALMHAIDSGCNLIDTSSGYMNGESENLIGKILQDNSKKKLFVVTKAGYINNDNLKLLNNLNRKGKAITDLVNINSEFKHSIHPEYLDAQIKLSLKRLNRNHLDGFLLHSPEYYFEQKDREVNKDEYYRRIKKAFEFLEEQVKKNVIRYYGVSSNTLPYILNEKNATDLTKLISIAKQTYSSNSFKLIQFPYNIIEKNATTPSADGKNLVEIAKENNILTFANRPLNANDTDGLLRLAVYDYEKIEVNVADEIQVFNYCFSVISDQLKEFDSDCGVEDISILSIIKKNWMSIANSDAFGGIFQGKFYPFLNLIYNDNIPKESLKLFQAFESIAWKYHLKTSSEKAIKYIHSNNLEYLLNKSNPQSLSNSLCNEYLKSGIDHILVGMRKVEYVDDMKSLF
jgi:aryl-alcohol dehydrogenase-like predicted oxidoreductase